MLDLRVKLINYSVCKLILEINLSYLDHDYQLFKKIHFIFQIVSQQPKMESRNNLAKPNSSNFNVRSKN